MKAAWVSLVVLVVVLLAWLFLRKKTPSVPVTGSQYVPQPVATPAPNNGASSSGLTSALQNIFTNKLVGNAICTYFGGGKVPSACSEINKVSQATVAGSVAVGKATVTAAVTSTKTTVAAPVTAVKDIASGNVKGAAGAVVAASVAPVKAVASVGKSIGHAITNLF